MIKRTPRGGIADEFLVSVGMAKIAGEQMQGIALRRIGESTIRFLPFTALDGGPAPQKNWKRVPASAYTPTAAPIDERLIRGVGMSGHQYVIEKPRPVQSDE